MPFECVVELRAGARVERGLVTDLSLRGLKAEMQTEFVEGELLNLRIVLSEPHDLAFEVGGRLLHVEAGWVGVRFEPPQLDVEVMEHLRILVGTTLGDLNQPLDEFLAWLGPEGVES